MIVSLFVALGCSLDDVGAMRNPVAQLRNPGLSENRVTTALFATPSSCVELACPNR
ncbi:MULTISPECIES: hypothetical protein [Bradyrhizobium]|uniref:Uncharacterized protein n=1 Tax=Bradyrhizobium brasilense TaxID=1419277 RepID=A0ABY8JR25_9BRAD|nr:MULTISPECIES: hypothetical protein [Bradyrhizobium]MCP1914180.1 hypothetical protein [Bradyrhizobium elkanii]MCC8945641.1 hypothetical protein [Bradyrhizobium brasilense]MCP1850026.1 hypothetical protein [Bradyrhizobium sp. USDA 4541]MCP1924442.1 hypothetical protein [Bradyrhizobium sp. USDA 4532]WFU66513.1 hypothetical protein QA636_13800 [Bradyrhizobium brasilense]